MTRTTPPRPADIAAVVPQLAPLARPGPPVHPRPGSPSACDSSIGGPLLWPAAEPWPYCDGPHEPDGVNPATSPGDVRLQRRIRPVALLPVAQLYTRDVPLLCPPGQADLLQVLWCPFDHPDPYPRTALFWRSAAGVTSILTDPPEPAAVANRWYVPEPCTLDPELVTEYPNALELSEDLQELVGRWSAREEEGTALDSVALDRADAIDYAIDSAGLYWGELSVAPGWKVGGWGHWGRTDPNPQFCPACGTRMTPLLTIASKEWDDSTRSWIPQEDQAHTEPSAAWPEPTDPAMIEIGDLYTLQLYACPAFPEHPHAALVQ
jgi:hypothetical protein